jgi:hypothetical protein
LTSRRLGVAVKIESGVSELARLVLVRTLVELRLVGADLDRPLLETAQRSVSVLAPRDGTRIEILPLG